MYTLLAIGITVYLIFWVAPFKGQSNILVYIVICSLIGSLSVAGCKGLSIAIKLTLSGRSQLQNPLAWFFVIAVAICITIQMNYLNKSLDIFNTSLVTPIYYVMFTTFTITASAILFKEWSTVTASDIVGSLCGFSVIVCGVFLLHAFKDINFTFKDLLLLTNQANDPGPQDSSGVGGAEGVSLVVEGNENCSTANSGPWNRTESQNRSGSNTDSDEEEIVVSERVRFISQQDDSTLS